MASKSIVEVTGSTIRKVKPIYSSTLEEARRRVLRSYKGWIKHFPVIIHQYKLPYTDVEIKLALKKQYMKNAHVQDIRIIDRLIYHAETELKSVKETWTPTWTARNVLFAEQIEPRPKDFLSKFFAGKD